MYQFAHNIRQDIETISRQRYTHKRKDVSDVGEDIQKMMNNPEFSDVIFRCKDGARVHASRLFLAARNTVFHRMLCNGMAESQLPEITLHGVSSIELLSIMEFLYTGALKKHAPKDWLNAYHVIAAANFFSIKRLKLVILNYLLDEVESVDEDVEAAAKFLSITVEFIAIGSVVKLIARELVRILLFKSLKPEQFQVLSAEALLYFLEATQAKPVEKGTQVQTATEFVRFRNVVLWCACKQFSGGCQDIVRAVPPEIACTVELLEQSSNGQDLMTCEQREMYSKIKGALALSVQPYLPLINLQHIAPDDLVHIVGPMDIVPSFDVMNALRFHALRPPFKMEEETLGWSTYKNNRQLYKMYEDGCRIQQIAPGKGLAKYPLCIDSNVGGFYEWEILIEGVCRGFIEIGLRHYYHGTYIPKEGDTLSGVSSGCSGSLTLRMDRKGVSIKPEGKNPVCHTRGFSSYGKNCSQLVYGKDYAHKDSKVRVSFNLSESRCSFAMDDEDYGVAWTFFPSGIFFPAVSLGTGASGTVRIRVLRVGEKLFSSKST